MCIWCRHIVVCSCTAKWKNFARTASSRCGRSICFQTSWFGARQRRWGCACVVNSSFEFCGYAFAISSKSVSPLFRFDFCSYSVLSTLVALCFWFSWLSLSLYFDCRCSRFTLWSSCSFELNSLMFRAYKRRQVFATFAVNSHSQDVVCMCMSSRSKIVAPKNTDKLSEYARLGSHSSYVRKTSYTSENGWNRSLMLCVRTKKKRFVCL